MPLQFLLSSSSIGRIYNLGEFHFCVHFGGNNNNKTPFVWININGNNRNSSLEWHDLCVRFFNIQSIWIVMFLYSQSVEDANNSGMNLLDQSVIKKGMDSSPPPTKVSKVFPVHSCLYDAFSLKDFIVYKTPVFVHNHGTVAIWMKMPVGRKGWGRDWRQKPWWEEPETIAIFSQYILLAV